MTPSQEDLEPPDLWAQGVGGGAQAGEGRGQVFRGTGLQSGEMESSGGSGMAADGVNMPNPAEGALRCGKDGEFYVVCILPP